MPTYRFECKKCNCQYEDLVAYDETGKYKTVKCPECKSKRKEKIATSCQDVLFDNPMGSKMKGSSWTYRGGHFMEKAKDTRRRAEAASHMGATPYSSIDDISNNNYIGQIE